jgi:hypothetical protein
MFFRAVDNELERRGEDECLRVMTARLEEWRAGIIAHVHPEDLVLSDEAMSPGQPSRRRHGPRNRSAWLYEDWFAWIT